MSIRILATGRGLLQRALLPKNSTIKEVILNLDQTSLKITLVTNPDGTLYGTVSDGDIRRALIRGSNIHDSIEHAVNRNPIVAKENISPYALLRKMRAHRITQIPIVNAKNLIQGLGLWSELQDPASKENPIIIMAGGRGTRLGRETEHRPKPMLKVAGKPIIQHIIDKALLDGYINITISVHYLGKIIERFLGDGRKYGVKITYIREEHPLGTAGSLSLLKDLPKVPLVVTNGDVITDVSFTDLLNFHTENEADATMVIRPYEMENQYGVVKLKGNQIVGFTEKPIYHSNINAGIYALKPEVLGYLKYNTPCDMPSLFEHLKKNGKKLLAFPMYESWMDIGRPEELDLARKSISKVRGSS